MYTLVFYIFCDQIFCNIISALHVASICNMPLYTYIYGDKELPPTAA
jgi:hypothetical protein